MRYDNFEFSSPNQLQFQFSCLKWGMTTLNFRAKINSNFNLVPKMRNANFEFSRQNQLFELSSLNEIWKLWIFVPKPTPIWIFVPKMRYENFEFYEKTIFPKNKIKYFNDFVAVCKISKLLQIFCVYEFFSIYGNVEMVECTSKRFKVELEMSFWRIVKRWSSNVMVCLVFLDFCQPDVLRKWVVSHEFELTTTQTKMK